MTIRTYTHPEVIYRYWEKVKEEKVKDMNSIRVLDGELYSLIDDEDFYENYGCRKHINSLLYDWDWTRDYALKDKKEQGNGTSIISRTDHDQERVDRGFKAVGKQLEKIIQRLEC